MRRWVLLTTYLCLAAVTAVGAEASGPDHDRAAGSGEEHGFHRNHLAFFLGVTSGGEHEDAAPTIGVDYERQLTRVFGIGAMLDVTGGDRREGVLGIPFVLHASRAAKIVVAPSVERIRETRETEPLLRLGFLYDFEVGRMTVAPTFNVDFVEGDQLYVVGVYVGWGF